MKITENLKNKVKEAQKQGKEVIIVSKSKNYNKYAFVTVSFDEILKAELGSNIDTGRTGSWETKENPLPDNGVFYQDIFRY